MPLSFLLFSQPRRGCPNKKYNEEEEAKMSSSDFIDPLDILSDRGERQPKFLTPFANPLMGALAGFGAACFINFGFRKPPFSGLQQHLLLSGIGGGLGVYFDRKRDEYMAKRDAVLRHYVELHPEDFPKIQRKKYKDVMESWVPIR